MIPASLSDFLADRPDRCGLGFHVEQHPAICNCSEMGEWAVFTRALRRAADDHGRISQTDVRPLIQAIPHKHRGQLYRRAVAEGLIRPDGYEQSTDLKGRDTDKSQRRYRLASP